MPGVRLTKEQKTIRDAFKALEKTQVQLKKAGDSIDESKKNIDAVLLALRGDQASPASNGEVSPASVMA